MNNEIMLLVNLIVVFSLVAVWYFVFGKNGIVCFMAIALILANIEVVILIDAFGMQQTLGNILFASTFLITDILSEIYGKKEAKKAVHIGIVASVTLVLISQMWLLYIPSDSDYAFTSIATVFASTPRLIVASLVVNIVVQQFDVWLYHALWKMTTKLSGSSSKYLWLRNNCATLVAQFINAFLFNFLAFYGAYDVKTLVAISLSSYVIFIFTSLADTPVLYAARYIHKWRVTQNKEPIVASSDKNI